jgi:hypothetical protein
LVLAKRREVWWKGFRYGAKMWEQEMNPKMKEMIAGHKLLSQHLKKQSLAIVDENKKCFW